jgi:type IV secretion system protein VirB4
MNDVFPSALRALFGGPRDLEDMLPYLFEESNHAVATRSGLLVSVVKLAGVNPFTASESELDDTNDRLAELVDKSGNNFSFHFHKIQSAYQDLNYQPKAFVDTGFGQDLDRAWRDHIVTAGLCIPVLFLSVIERKSMAERLPILGSLLGQRRQDALTERLAGLAELAQRVCEILTEGSELLAIDDGTLTGFLRAISTGVYAPMARSETGSLIDDIRMPLEIYDRAVEIREDFDTRYASVISVANLSPQTHSGLLDTLYSDPDILISCTYQPLLLDLISAKAVTRLEQTLEESAGGKIAAQLQEAAEDLQMGQIGFGDSQTVVTVYAQSPEALRKKVTAVTAILKSRKLKVVVEKQGLAAAWFARYPGNYEFQKRPLTISNRNFSDFAALHMVRLGKPASECYWATPITTFKSCANSPYDFSFHGRFASSEAEPPFASTLIVGPPDAGKSTIMAFLAAQARRTNCRIIAFDKDQSLEMPLRALGGTYTSVRAGRNTGLNPLASETDEEGQAWLRSWLTALLERKGHQLSVSDSEKLARTIESNATAPAIFQDFTNFATRFLSFEGNIASRVNEWSPKGQYGWVFGQDRAPIVDFSTSEIVGVDMTALLNMEIERTALLAYLFRQIEKTVSARTPTLLVLEEAGVFLDDLYFQRELKTWLATLRKKNVVVVMLVQFVSQIRACAAGASILEGLQNQLILPHYQAGRDSYDGLNLTDAELSFLLSPQVGSRRALWRDGQSSNILDTDLSALGPYLSVLGGGHSAERKFGLDWRDNPHFWKGDTT